jgi:TPR repeat protein
MPHEGTTYMTCCGQTFCIGCNVGIAAENPICPFCREVIGDDDDKLIQMVNSRMAANDPEASFQLGYLYQNGAKGFPEDHEKAFELYTKAADLGSIEAHRELGNHYICGDGTVKDIKKAVHHWEISAVKGNALARHSLGVYEIGEENFRRACRHFIIAAKDGVVDAMDNVRNGYKEGFVTKEEFEETLRSFQKSRDEMKSEQREKAASLLASMGL